MTATIRGSLRATLALALLVACAAPRALAQGAPADTTLEGYVRSMADSTDAWFGLSAQPVDTTGLDSARVYYLAHPKARPGAGHRLSFSPAFAFNRVLGPAPGAGASYGAGALGRFDASAQWAMGAHRWLGGGSWVRGWNDEATATGWTVRARTGRWCDSMDRDFFQPGLSTLRAWLLGTDRSHYLRLDGAKLAVERTSPRFDVGVAARSMRETPMATEATWWLFGHGPQVVGNIAATPARVREASAWLALRPARTNAQLEARVWSAGRVLGGDAAYTRLRLAAGHTLGLGRHLALATEADYGRLRGAALPQDAFWLGGPTHYTIGENSESGTGRAFARSELLLVDPLQRVLGLERTPMFPIQLGAFANTAARWGFDPVTGAPQLTARDWPGAAAWRSEAGVSVMYRPGLPDPDTFVRFAIAWPLGPGSNATGISVTYTRPFVALRAHAH